MSEFLLPDLGEGLPDAEIVAWHVGPGDHVVADQPLLAVETDKAVVEIPSPKSGHIAQLHAAEGDIVRVGEPLVRFSDEAPADVGAIVGDLEQRERTVHAPARKPRPPAGVRAAPAVRARARRLGVDLGHVVGTGPDGTISGADVDAAATKAPEGTESLRGARRSMAMNMARAHAEVVPATVTDEADIGGWGPTEDATLRLVRAVATACTAEPALNVTFHGPDVGRSPNEHVDLGVAVDTDDGLFVPVLRDVADREPEDLRAELDALKAAVADRSIGPESLREPTVTLSNFGAIGGRHGSLVVVPPQVAIVGAGRAREAAVSKNGALATGTRLPLSLTFDHRVVTGGEAARFLNALVADLELSS